MKLDRKAWVGPSRALRFQEELFLILRAKGGFDPFYPKSPGRLKVGES